MKNKLIVLLAALIAVGMCVVACKSTKANDQQTTTPLVIDSAHEK